MVRVVAVRVVCVVLWFGGVVWWFGCGNVVRCYGAVGRWVGGEVVVALLDGRGATGITHVVHGRGRITPWRLTRETPAT